MPHGITYGVKSLHQPPRLFLDLPTPEGWKAEFTWVLGYIQRWFSCLQTNSHPSNNLSWWKATTFIEHNVLTHHMFFLLYLLPGGLLAQHWGLIWLAQCATRIIKTSYRPLQASREVSNAIKQGPRSLGNGSLELLFVWQFLQELSKPRLATPLHACVLVTYLLIYLGTYLFTRLLTRYVLQPLLYKLSKIVLI